MAELKRAIDEITKWVKKAEDTAAAAAAEAELQAQGRSDRNHSGPPAGDTNEPVDDSMTESEATQKQEIADEAKLRVSKTKSRLEIMNQWLLIVKNYGTIADARFDKADWRSTQVMARWWELIENPVKGFVSFTLRKDVQQ